MLRLSTTIPMLVLVLAAPLHADPLHTYPPSIVGQNSVQADCSESLDELTRNPDWFQELLDPVLTSQPEIYARLDLYSRIHECLSDESRTVSADLETIDTLVEYFLIFAGGLDTSDAASSLTLISLDASADPAVHQLRDLIGISPPPGFVYVRSYASRQDMPALVRVIFENPAIQGVTIFDRYIAVLAGDPGSQSPLASRTLSHELVHAYVNSAGGPRGFEYLPTWYAEGLAVHFSQTAEPSCVRYLSAAGEILTECQMAGEDYKQYAENFKFLEAALGDAKFQAAVKQSIEEHDPSLMYSELGIASYDALVQRAAEWRQQRNTTAAWKFAGGSLILFAMIAVILMSANRQKPRHGAQNSAANADAGTATVEAMLQARAQWLAPLGRPPRPLSADESAHATILWNNLSRSPHLLGSVQRLQRVLEMRSQEGHSEWHLDYKCTNCYRWAVLLLPNDVSYEQYANGIQDWAKANSINPQSLRVILRPYAVCLYCGAIYGADSFGHPWGPRPLDDGGQFCTPDIKP